MNKSSLGQVTLSVTPEDALLLKWNELEVSLSKSLYPDTVSKLKKQVDDGLLSQQGFASAGLSLDFDLSDFSLGITVPLDLIKPQSLSLQPENRSLTSEKQANLSGYLNLYSSYLYQIDEANDSSSNQLDLASEAVLNWQGWVFENDNEFTSSSTSDEANITRTGTRLIHDMPIDGMRVSIGDSYSYGSYFQSSSRILGASIAHDFSLVSDVPIRPSASRSFTLSSPSSVDVIVSDQVVQRLNLSAGTYSLSDIPISEGTNDITLRITDSVGVVQYVNFDITTGLDLFAQGELEYEFHMGIPAELQDRLDYDFDEPLMTGYLEYGVTSSWTIGVNGQGDRFSQQIGFKNIYASSVGQFAFENVFSYNDVTGQAYRLVYSTFTDNSATHKDFSIGYEYATQYFSQLGYRPDSEDNFQASEHILQANYSFFPTPTLQTSLSANISRDYDSDVFDKSLGVSFSKELANNQFRYSVGTQWDQDEDGSELSVSLSLTYKFNNLRELKLSHQSSSDTTRLEYSQESDLRYVGAYSATAGIEKNEDEAAALDLTTQYNGNRFFASFDQASYYDQLNAQSALHQSRLSLSSSIAFADGSWALGKTINDSFALVNAHSSLGDKTITLDQYNGEYRASNDGFSTILVSDLSAYSNSALSVDVKDLPPGYDIGSGIWSFYPSYRSGFSVTVGTAANISIIATLLDDSKAPLSLLVGSAVCIKDSVPKEIQFFTNKSGRFAITGLKPCTYQITLNNEKKSTFEIDVKEGEQLQRKGEIYVH